MARRALVPLVILAVSACATAGHRQLDARTEIFQYEIRNENRGGLQLELPVVGGGFRLGASGSTCQAVMRLVDRRVVEVNCTGDNDDVAGREGVCAPLVLRAGA